MPFPSASGGFSMGYGRCRRTFPSLGAPRAKPRVNERASGASCGVGSRASLLSSQAGSHLPEKQNTESGLCQENVDSGNKLAAFSRDPGPARGRFPSLAFFDYRASPPVGTPDERRAAWNSIADRPCTQRFRLNRLRRFFVPIPGRARTNCPWTCNVFRARSPGVCPCLWQRTESQERLISANYL